MCVLFVASSLLFDRIGLYNVRNVHGFSTVILVSRKDVVSARGREIDTPHLHLLRMEWPRQTLLRRGFNTTHTLLSTRKATRKISGDVAQMVERSLRTMSISRGNKPFFFFLFFSREGRRPKAEKPPNTHHTHTHHHHPARRDETRRDETLARALDAIGEVVRGLLVSRAQPGFPHHQQQQQQRILSCILAAFCVLLLCTHPP